jgi:hypothetical protein
MKLPDNLIQNQPLCKATCPPLEVPVYLSSKLKTSLAKGTCIIGAKSGGPIIFLTLSTKF